MHVIGLHHGSKIAEITNNYSNIKIAGKDNFEKQELKRSYHNFYCRINI